MLHDLNYFLSLWKLAEPDFIEKTKMCQVYKVRTQDGENRALKIMNDIGMRFEKDSSEWYKHMNGRGAAKLYASDHNGLLLEYLDQGELADLVGQGNDEQATYEAAKVIKKLHDQDDPLNIVGFKSMKEHFVCLFETDLTHALIKPAQDMALYLLDTQKQDDIRLLHADIHHKNILKGARGWLAIDPQKAIGDRHYEVANMFKNPIGYDGCFDITRIHKMAEIFALELDMNKNRILQFAFAYMGLSAAWHNLDEENFETTLTIAEILYDQIRNKYS